MKIDFISICFAVLCVYLSPVFAEDVLYVVGQQPHETSNQLLRFNWENPVTNDLIVGENAAFAVAGAGDLFYGVQLEPTLFDVFRLEDDDTGSLVAQGRFADVDFSGNDLTWTSYKTLLRAPIIDGDLGEQSIMPFQLKYAAGLTPVATNSDFTFWGDYQTGTLYRATSAGENIERIVEFDGPLDWNVLAADDDNLYWSNWLKAEVWRSDIDGSNAEIIIDTFEGFSNVNRAVDIELTDSHIYLLQNSKVQKYTLEGELLDSIPTGLETSWSLAVVQAEFGDFAAVNLDCNDDGMVGILDANCTRDDRIGRDHGDSLR